MKYMKHSLVAVILLVLLPPASQVKAGEAAQAPCSPTFARAWEALVDSLLDLLGEDGVLVREEAQGDVYPSKEEPQSPLASKEPEAATEENPVGPGDEMGGGTDPLG